jgi:hypothetical protein
MNIVPLAECRNSVGVADDKSKSPQDEMINSRTAIAAFSSGEVITMMSNGEEEGSAMLLL